MKSKLEKAESDMQILAELWPKVFSLDPSKAKQIKPLAIGIHNDIYPLWKAKGINGTCMRRALWRYCEKLAYQHALAKGKPRINLLGQIVGEVTDKHRELAADKIRSIREKRKAKHKRDKVTYKSASSESKVNHDTVTIKFRNTLTLRKSA